MKSRLKITLTLVLLASLTYAQGNISGYWDGKIKLLTMDLDFQLKIEKTKKSLTALMYIPSQKLKDYQLQVFTFSKNKVHFELPSQAGIANFDGVLKADSITGNILQAGIKGSFHLVRSVEPIESPATEVKKEEPLPYLEEEVAFKSGRILLAGTLTRPKENKKYPAVILLTADGAQNRDEDISGFRIFERIADFLTRKGLAVLRYDDRGVGGSTGNTIQSTTDELADDAKAAMDFLKKQRNIDTKKIGFIGHSEGALMASMVASYSPDIAFIVLISGSGVPGGDILLEQQKLILNASGIEENLIEKNRELQIKINNVLIEGKDFDSIRPDIEEFARRDFDSWSPEIKNSILDKKGYINSVVESQIAMFNNPWYRFYVPYNPSASLQKIKIPVLMIFGGLDLQVSVNQNKPKMEEALDIAGNKNYKTVVFPEANHLYQEAKSGIPTEYEFLKKEFVPGFLDTIGNWILQIVR